MASDGFDHHHRAGLKFSKVPGQSPGLEDRFVISKFGLFGPEQEIVVGGGARLFMPAQGDDPSLGAGPLWFLGG